MMDQEKLKALSEELAKDVKTPEDPSTLSAQLTKLTVEAALNAEMDNHLGYYKHDLSGGNQGNSRNLLQSFSLLTGTYHISSNFVLVLK